LREIPKWTQHERGKAVMVGDRDCESDELRGTEMQKEEEEGSGQEDGFRGKSLTFLMIFVILIEYRAR